MTDDREAKSQAYFEKNGAAYCYLIFPVFFKLEIDSF